MGAAALLAATTFVPATASAGGPENGSGFNQAGNILIADQFNTGSSKWIATTVSSWHLGDGSSVAGPKSIVGTNDAERVGDLTLIAGTGVPAGADPSCSDRNGSAYNRVILVNEDAGSCGSTGRRASRAPASTR